MVLWLLSCPDEISFVYEASVFRYNYRMGRFDFPKVRRDVIKVMSLSEPSDEKEYWLSKTPKERLEAVEIIRQVIYGYDPSTARLQRFFEITQRP